MGQEELTARLLERFGDAVERVPDPFGDAVLRVEPQALVAVMTALREPPEDFAVLLDLTCVDHEVAEGRLELVYHLLSISRNSRLRLKVSVPAAEPVIASLTPLWRNADWLEREVFDMFGIRFRGHPDLRRILMYDEFEGHPLRKDYPIERVQPLVPYRTEDNLDKLAPFGPEEGQPFGRIDWQARLRGDDVQVAPAIAVQQGQKRNTSETTASQTGAPRPEAIPGKA